MPMQKSLTTIGALSCLGAITGCVGPQAPYALAYVVSGANFAESSVHSKNRQLLIDGEKPKTADQLVLRGHDAQSGRGIILAIREQTAGSILRTDQSSFWNLTIHLPQGDVSHIKEVRLDLNSEAFAFWSSSLTNAPGSSGCIGYSKSGTVTIERSDSKTLIAKIDILVDAVSPLRWPSDCRDDTRIQRRTSVQAEPLSELVKLDKAIDISER